MLEREATDKEKKLSPAWEKEIDTRLENIKNGSAVLHDAFEVLEELEATHESNKLSPAWEKEIKRRVKDIENGTAEMLDYDEVMAKMEKLITE